MLRCCLATRGVVAGNADRDIFVSFELERIRIECWVEAKSCWNVSRGVGGGGETGGGVRVSIRGSTSCASVEMVSSSSSSSGPYDLLN